MNSSPKSTTSDEGYDHLIAFLVIIGALSFILTQSFPKKSSSPAIASATPVAAIPKKKSKKVYKPSKSSEYYQKKQAINKYRADGLRNWTDQLEEQQIHNTPFRVPKTKEIVPVIAGTAATNQLVAKDTTATLPLTSRNLAKEEKIVPPTGTTVIKEEPIFIDTNTKKKEVATPKPSKVAPTPTTKSPPKEALPTIQEPVKEEPKVESYEASSPKINIKSAASEKSALTSTISKKEEEVSCVIMIAALKDRGNIDRLIQSLEKEKYEVYNKISGKHRTIGIRTSCDPAVHQPVLREIKKKYTKSAFFMKR